MRLTILAAASASILLSSCGNLPEKISGDVTADQVKASQLVQNVGSIDTSSRVPSPVVYKKGIWIAKKAVKLQQQEQLPPIFHEHTTFSRTVYSLSEFAERITVLSGIPTKVTADAILASGQSGQQSAGGASAPAPAAGRVAGSVVPSPIANTQTATGGTNNQQNTAIRIVYPNGDLKGLLDTAAARFGVFWKYVDGTVRLYYTDTRTFQINAIPGDSALTATVGSGSTSGSNSGGGGGGGGGGDQNGGVSASNNQKIAVNSKLSVYANIEKAISVMLSSSGQVVSSPATGTITVTDTPDKLDRIAHFIASENKTMMRQVMINVTVLAVTLSHNDNLGINWNLVYAGLNNPRGSLPGKILESTIPHADTSSTAFAAGILDTSGSKLAGSTLIIDALSKQGKVRRDTTASVVTLNNQPVPVQVAKQTSYLKSSETTLAANVGATTTLKPGMVTSGFNMSILPHILDNGTVMLQFSTDISSLNLPIRLVESGGSKIESPELDTRNFLQRVAMKSNQTLIISGYEQTDDDLKRQGVGQPSNYLLGGGYTAARNKEIIVILITPVIVDDA